VIVSLSLLILSQLAIPARANSKAGWIMKCEFSHRLKDDPIVFAGQPGASHLHDFYGNKSTDANSTLSSLLKAGTTCALKGDTAAYWAPTLIRNGHKIRPNHADFYYRNRTSPRWAVRPFPSGLSIVAGNSHATRPQPIEIVYWGCGSETIQKKPTDCGSSELVTAHIKFPDCWDGEHLDSWNHKRHMAYSVERDDDTYHCPKSHPIPVPRLTFRLEWPIHNGEHVRLSSGPFYTLHADFFNSWNQRVLLRLVRRCIRHNTDCGSPED